MAQYATLTDLRTYGITMAQANDAVALNALEGGSRIIDRHTGTMFGATQQTITVADVRNMQVALPRPFSAVASVVVNGRILDPTMYTVETANGEAYGIRLYVPGFVDVDGFQKPQSAVTLGFRQFGQWSTRGPYGSTVAVTATFGYPSVPWEVNRATLLLAEDIIVNDPLPDPEVGTLDVEGYRYQRLRTPRTSAAGGTAVLGPTEDSTGNLKADRLLRPFRRDLVMVG